MWPFDFKYVFDVTWEDKTFNFDIWQLKGDDIKRQIWRVTCVELSSWKPYDTLCKNSTIPISICCHLIVC